MRGVAGFAIHCFGKRFCKVCAAKCGGACSFLLKGVLTASRGGTRGQREESGGSWCFCAAGEAHWDGDGARQAAIAALTLSVFIGLGNMGTARGCGGRVWC